MSLLTDIKNALLYLARGDWREFAFRLKVYTGRIDLKNDPPGTFTTGRSYPYSGTSGSELSKVLDTLDITRHDAILDIGSGKGGAMITFAQYPFAKISGIEISPELAAIAEQNFRKLKIENLDTVTGDAAEYSALDEYNYFYLFNPFPEVVLSAVMENIETSLKNNPRVVTIIYSNPENHQVISANPCFKKTAEFNLHYLDYFIYKNDQVQ